MVEDARQQLDTVVLNDIHRKTVDFTAACNEIMSNSDNNDFTVEIGCDFRPQRVKVIKSMAGEKAKYSRPQDPMTRFRAEVYRSVIDHITSSIEEQFTYNRGIILDTAYLDQRRFQELVEGGIPPDSLDKVAELTGLDSASLREELSTFSRLYDTLQNEFTTIPCDSGSHSESDTEQGVSTGVSADGEESAQETYMPVNDLRFIKCAGSCKRYLKCCYKFLHRYSLHALLSRIFTLLISIYRLFLSPKCHVNGLSANWK